MRQHPTAGLEVPDDRSKRAGRLTLSLLLILLLYRSGTAYGYSCGTPSSGHCYATATWQAQPEYFGAYTDIVEANLACPSGCGGFVDDEIWLVDDNSSGCQSNGFGMCWVEAGYIATEGSSKVYFWADARPTTSSTFNLHLLGGTDPAGVNDHFMLIKDGRVSPQTFLVFIYNDSLSTLYNGTSAISSGTPMKGNRIIIGSELAGSSGASADNANFTRNIWAVQALGPEYVFWYNRQTTKGSVTSASPPTGSWTVDPASPPPPEGGQFTTHCCS
jgi:hypothetical protein